MNLARIQYRLGLAFKTEEEAEQHLKESILLFKLRKWAEEHNEGWAVNWNERDVKYFVEYEFGKLSLILTIELLLNYLISNQKK